MNPEAIRNDITCAGCWAHARCKFHDALLAGNRQAAGVLRSIQRVFWIEHAVPDRVKHRKLDPQQLAELRVDVGGRLSRRVLREIFDLVFALKEDPSTPTTEILHQAVRYVVRQRSPLLAHLDNGRIPIHNNDTERDLRRVVTGREIWLTCASEPGGQIAGRLCSLVMSCKLAKINVEASLENSRGPRPRHRRSSEATPWGWVETRAAELPKGSA